MHAIPRSRSASIRQHRGAALLESLIAFVFLAAGTVSALQLESRLRLHADLARQRSEAVRHGIGEMEMLRAMAGSMSTPGSPAGAGIVDAERSIDASSASGTTSGNASFRVVRHVDGDVSAAARPVSISVEWANRGGGTERVELSSIVGRGDAAYSGALALGASGGAPRGAFGRSPSIPLDAQPLVNGRSAWKPTSAATIAYVFDDISGRVVQRCTGIAATTPSQALVAAHLTACSLQRSLLVSGTIRFAPANPASAQQRGNVLPETEVVLASTGGGGAASAECSSEMQKTVRYAANGSLHIADVAVTALPASLGLVSWDDTGDRFVAYRCVVEPAADGRWSGRTILVPHGWTIGSATDPAAHRVCRYVADLDGSGAVDANIEHPAVYHDVSTALAAQNFLVVGAADICPGSPSSTVQAGATEPHQP